MLQSTFTCSLPCLVRELGSETLYMVPSEARCGSADPSSRRGLHALSLDIFGSAEHVRNRGRSCTCEGSTRTSSDSQQHVTGASRNNARSASTSWIGKLELLTNLGASLNRWRAASIASTGSHDMKYKLHLFTFLGLFRQVNRRPIT